MSWAKPATRYRLIWIRLNVFAPEHKPPLHIELFNHNSQTKRSPKATFRLFFPYSCTFFEIVALFLLVIQSSSFSFHLSTEDLSISVSDSCWKWKRFYFSTFLTNSSPYSINFVLTLRFHKPKKNLFSLYGFATSHSVTETFFSLLFTAPCAPWKNTCALLINLDTKPTSQKPNLLKKSAFLCSHSFMQAHVQSLQVPIRAFVAYTRYVFYCTRWYWTFLSETE